MAADTPLWKAHDLSQQLQDKIEVLPNVGRAFVHVDHETTHTPVCPSIINYLFELLTILHSSSFVLHCLSFTFYPLIKEHLKNVWLTTVNDTRYTCMQSKI